MGLLPEFNTRVRALMAAAQEAGHSPQITSAYRSPEDQARAINSVSRNVLGRPASFIEYARGIPGYAAPVGASMHQRGEAVDFASGPALNWLRQNASAYGVRFPESLAKSDPVHAEVDPNFWGPVQDPNDRNKPVQVPPSAQPDPTKTANYVPRRSGLSAAQPMMALGGPKEQPGAAPMALSDSAPQQGFSLDNWMMSPLFQMGAGVLGSPTIGQGLMQGSQNAAQMAQAQMRQRREAELFPLQKQLMQAQVTKALEPATTDDIREFQFAKRENPSLTFMDFMQRKKASGLGNQPIMGVGPDGKPAVLRMAPEGLQAAAIPPGYSVDPRNVMKVDTGTGTAVVAPDGRTITTVGKDVAGAETQRVVGRETGEKVAGLSKAEQAIQSYEKQQELIKQDIKSAIAKVKGGWATGLPGAIGRSVLNPTETDAKDLDALLNTIKGNIGFDKLQQMRMESPTGGALGAVAVQELEMLQSVLGSLSTSQSQKQLEDNLDRLEKTLDYFKGLRRQALEDDKKRFGGAVVGPPNVPIGATPSVRPWQTFTTPNGITIRGLD